MCRSYIISDLEIVFDTKLTSYSFIETSRSKAFKIFGYICIYAQYKLNTSIKFLYCNLVSSVLKYGSILYLYTGLIQVFC